MELSTIVPVFGVVIPLEYPLQQPLHAATAHALYPARLSSAMALLHVMDELRWSVAPSDRAQAARRTEEAFWDTHRAFLLAPGLGELLTTLRQNSALVDEIRQDLIATSTLDAAKAEHARWRFNLVELAADGTLTEHHLSNAEFWADYCLLQRAAADDVCLVKRQLGCGETMPDALPRIARENLRRHRNWAFDQALGHILDDAREIVRCVPRGCDWTRVKEYARARAALRRAEATGPLLQFPDEPSSPAPTVTKILLGAPQAASRWDRDELEQLAAGTAAGAMSPVHTPSLTQPSRRKRGRRSLAIA